jgi:hypothetical protein
MEPETRNRRIDWKSWSAYVLGRHPHTLQMCHALIWSPDPEKPLNDDPELWNQVRSELEELDLALTYLAESSRVVAAAVVPFREAKERFAKVHEELRRELEDPFFTGHYTALDDNDPPGRLSLSDLRFHSLRLLLTGDRLRPLWQLGTQIGSDLCYLTLNERASWDKMLSEFKFDEDSEEEAAGAEALGPGSDPGGVATAEENPDPPYCPDDLRVDGDLLRGLIEGAIESAGLTNAWNESDFPDRIDELCEGLRPPEGTSLSEADEHQLRALKPLDELVRSAIEHLLPPAPVLVFDRDALYVHDKRVAYNEHTASWFAILWVLAEHVLDEHRIAEKRSKALTRAEIKAKSKFGPDKSHLQESISRLRGKILRPAIEKYYREKGLELPADIRNRCYIGPPERHNRRSEFYAPYQLDLEPEQIQILCPRPEFKKPKQPRNRRS